MAVSRAVEYRVPVELMLITRAPLSAAWRMALTIALSGPRPWAFSALIGSSLTRQAMPETPSLLLPTAPMMPATAVPCDSSSCGVGVRSEEHTSELQSRQYL